MKSLAPGFLIAMPQLGDPNFHRSVVLMLEHNAEGAMGIVINRPAPLTLKELAQGQALPLSRLREQQSVFVGGPVEPSRGFVLHDRVDVREKKELLPGLFLSMTLDALGPLLKDGTARLRFCLGYAGWGPRQLDAELAAGSWLFTEATSQPVLDGLAGELWDGTLRGMGVDPAMLMPARGVH